MTVVPKPTEVAPPAEDEQGQTSQEAGEQDTDEQGEPETPPDPQEALRGDLDSVKADLAEARKELRRVQSGSDSNTAKLTKTIERLAAAQDKLVERLMDADSAKVFRAEQLLSSGQDTPAFDMQAEQERFGGWATKTLEREGIKWSPEAQQKFEAFAAEDPTPSGWRTAVAMTVAEIRKEEAKSARDDAKKQVDAEKAKNRRETRQAEAPIDRGGPAGGGRGQTKPLAEMTDDEFNAHIANKNREAAGRQRR